MSEDNLLGVQLDEYRLEALLGRGGMARVYRALDTGLNRYVAVKVIDTPYRSDEGYVKRFKIEAQAIARLDHPHVVHLFRYGEVNGMLYMAMQFIEGADLGFLLKSYRLDGEFIPSMDALRLVTEICQALDYVHAHGIIHRDIKPSNIMLTRDEGRVILTDFGLALRAEVGTRGEVFGSPHYIAPEQAVSSARSVPQSDLYSLGVILYEMFTGVRPFNATDPMNIAVLHISSLPPPPREVRPDLSLEIETVILKALEKKPEDRYQTGRALALALERAMRKQPVSILPTNRSIPERVTIGLAANPLAALPPIPAAVTPEKHVVDAEADTFLAPKEVPIPLNTSEEHPATAQMSPSEKAYADQEPSIPPTLPPRQAGTKPSHWILLSIAALAGLCIFAILVIGGLSFLLRSGNQIAGITQETSEPTVAARNTSAPAEQSSPSPAAVEDYRLKFWRCEDEGCLVVENTGSVSFPMPGLNLKGKESSLAGGAWGVFSLQPGQCVKVVKDEKWSGKIPEGVTCQNVGHPLMREGKESFWDNSFTVYYQDHKVADCMKKGSWCEVLVQR
jgi:serine/threonine protein kinase